MTSKGEKKTYKEDDIFKRREFRKKIDMFEQNAGDKPLFPHKMAEEMYRTRNRTTVQDIQKESEKLKDKMKIKVETNDSVNKQMIKAKDNYLATGKNTSLQEDDIFKRREFRKKIDMFEQNAGDKPLFPHKMAEEMYKIKNNLKDKDLVKSDSNPSSIRFIKSSSDKGKSK
ncbi:hypothetical protein NOVO_07515 [Rickettsiales bacterium Ac37b]|nr:hypothetical protein NOVO_07515 [Rickettsiales bacterium Ac37b]